MFKAILATIFLAIIVSFTVGFIDKVSANTEADWAIHHDVYQPTVNLVNLDGYQIEYWVGECVLRLGRSFTGSADTLTIRVADAIPTYELVWGDAEFTIVECETRK